MVFYCWCMFGVLVVLLFIVVIILFLGQGICLLVDQGFFIVLFELFNCYILLFFVLVFGLVVGIFVCFYLVFWIGECFVVDICKCVFDYLIELYFGFYEINCSFEIQLCLIVDIMLLQMVIGFLLLMVLCNVLMLVGGVLLMFVINVKLISIVVLVLLLVIVLILLFGCCVCSLLWESQDWVVDVGSYVGEIFGQIKIVQVYNYQVQDCQCFVGIVECVFDIVCKCIVQCVWLIIVVIVLVFGVVGVMFWVGGCDVIVGSILVGELVVFVFYSLIVGMVFGIFSEVIGELQCVVGVVECIVELFRVCSEICLLV